jgi:hypothetical protein
MPTKPFSVSSSGDNLLSIAAAGKTLRVIELYWQASGAVNVTLYAGASSGGTQLTGAMHQEAGTGVPASRNPDGHWNDKFNAAAQNTDLNINLSGAVRVDGWVDYVLF